VIDSILLEGERQMTNECPKTVTLGAVNWKGEWGNKRANLAKMKDKVKDAAQMGIDMICFPELALSGYECGDEAKKDHKPCSMHIEAAETVPGPSTEEMAQLAKELDIYIIFGMPEVDRKDPGSRYISAAIVGPEGVLGSYRKMHLATPPVWSEYYCFKPGNELPIFETKFGLVGLQICADYWMYPELTRILAFKGANIIFNPVGSAVSPGKIPMITNATAAMGQSTQIYVVSSNHVGKEKNVSYCGYSVIGGPGFPKFFKVFAQAEGEEEIVWSTVSFETQDNARRVFRVKEAGNWKLIADEYKKLAEHARISS
jgi:predicted amidohydrolase